MLATLIGTSPNLLISSVREEVMGRPYRLFDFVPFGLPLSILAVAFLSIGWRLLPKDRRGSTSDEKKFRIEDYTTEALLPEGSPMVQKRVADLEALGEGEVTVAAIIREHEHRYIPPADWVLFAGDVLDHLPGRPTTALPCSSTRKPSITAGGSWPRLASVTLPDLASLAIALPQKHRWRRPAVRDHVDKP